MLPEVDRFCKWLKRRNPHSSTPLHYASDLALFFAWFGESPDRVTPRAVDRFIEYAQARGHRIATINRRLGALRSFYHFLSFDAERDFANPVLPRRHLIRQGRRLPRDVEDPVLDRLFRVIPWPRDRCMFLLMLRCGLRVGEVRNLSLEDLFLQPAHGSLPRLRVHGRAASSRCPDGGRLMCTAACSIARGGFGSCVAGQRGSMTRALSQAPTVFRHC